MTASNMSNTSAFTDPVKIAEAAERIYKERYLEVMERTHRGEHVAIDVRTGEAFVGKYAEQAIMKAREQAPYGVFHLIRIGGRTTLGARFIGHQHPNWDWTLRSAG